MKGDSLIGKRFGRLLVIEKTDRKINGSFVWKCLCDCGNTFYSYTGRLNSGGVKSCGCYRKELSSERLKAKKNPDRYKIIRNQLFSILKNRAKTRKLDFNLSFSVFCRLSDSPCFYCNRPPSNHHKHQRSADEFVTYSGIDRFDSSQGYVEGNCVPCCIQCNKAKSNMTMKEFVEWLDRIYNNFSKTYIYKKMKENI